MSNIIIHITSPCDTLLPHNPSIIKPEVASSMSLWLLWQPPEEYCFWLCLYVVFIVSYYVVFLLGIKLLLLLLLKSNGLIIQVWKGPHKEIYMRVNVSNAGANSCRCPLRRFAPCFSLPKQEIHLSTFSDAHALLNDIICHQLTNIQKKNVNVNNWND